MMKQAAFFLDTDEAAGSGGLDIRRVSLDSSLLVRRIPNNRNL